jgi:hypothetical protein
MTIRARTLRFLPVTLMCGLAACSAPNPAVQTKFNQEASLPGGLPANPMQGKVITSWVDHKNATMSTLYGNDAAVHSARSKSQRQYPAGSMLSLVTWRQQEDPRWFGARPPATPVSVEFLTVDAAAGNLSYEYESYAGVPWKRTSTEEGPTPGQRAAFLLAQQAAVMP